jgi:hypothetical protein
VQHAALFKTVALRFRAVVWGAIAVLVGSGLVLATNRAIPLTEPGRWPSVFAVKIATVSLLLSLTFLHDMVMGPRIGRMLARPESERSAFDRWLLRYSSLVPRGSLLLGLVILFFAVMLVRT